MIKTLTKKQATRLQLLINAINVHDADAAKTLAVDIPNHRFFGPLALDLPIPHDSLYGLFTFSNFAEHPWEELANLLPDSWEEFKEAQS
jgi:hypothetical protein